MPAPEPLPMLRPFQEAVAYQLQRVPMGSDEFYALDDEAKRRAFTIAGLTRESSLLEAHRMATAAIATGKTKQELLDELGDLLDLEGAILPRPRLALIAQNNTAAAYAAGRWAQLADPELRALRPYLQYPLGPDDAKTSEICRRLQGFVARADHPVWQRIFPPNHHNERHIQVTSLTEEQARATGRVYEGADTGDYPFVDGQRILPDPGFDAPPQMLASDEAFLRGEAAELGEEIPRKTAADYGRPGIAEVRRETLAAAPRVAKGEDAWQAFRAEAGLDEAATSTILVDELGTGVRITRASLDGVAPDEASFIRATLENPFEAWLVMRAGERGNFTRRYLGLFNGGARRGIVAFEIEVTPDGWLMTAGRVQKRAIEGRRTGLLLRPPAGRRS